MARKQATSLTEIGDAAVSYITRHGYRQTQMAGLAREIGVSAGTLTTYVENKEALLHLATVFLIDPTPLARAALPFGALPRAKLVTRFAETVQERAQWPYLKQAIVENRVDQKTLRTVGAEVYGLIDTYGRSILFLDRLADELPEFTPVHVDKVRGGFMGDLVTLLLNAGSTHGIYGTAIIARAATEGISWSAMHRKREGLARLPIGDLAESDIRLLASHTFAAALTAALPDV